MKVLLFTTFFIGFLSVAFFYCLSAVIVIGAKFLYLKIKRQPAVKPTPEKKRIKSIVVDPNEINRIYVKKR